MINIQNNIKYLEDTKCSVGRLKVILKDQVEDDIANAELFSISSSHPTKDLLELLKFINNYTNNNKAAPDFEEVINHIIEENLRSSTTYTEVVFRTKIIRLQSCCSYSEL